MRKLWQWLKQLFFRTAAVQQPAAAGAPGQDCISTSPTPPQSVPELPPILTSALERPIKPPREKHDFTFHYLRKDLASLALDVLDRFEHLSTRRAEEVGGDMKLLEELWGCDFLMLDRDIGERMKGGDKWSAVSADDAAELAEIMWPIDYAIARTYESEDEDDEEKRPCLRLFRIYSVTPEQVRGKELNNVVPKMVRYITGYFFDNGLWHIGAGYMGWMNGQWVRLKIDGMAPGPRKARARWVAKVMACALTARYEWHVAFGTIPGGPRLLFPTNPAGSLRLFKNRELQGGQVKRDMLKHWVTEHWRDDKDSEGLIYVCNHLRGHTKFNWMDFGCELFVSQFDLEKNEFFKQQAHEWRSQRQHNRVKVKLRKKEKEHASQ